MSAGNSRNDMRRLAERLNSLSKYFEFCKTEARELEAEVLRLNNHFTGDPLPVMASAAFAGRAAVSAANPGAFIIPEWFRSQVMGYCDEGTLVRAADVSVRKN